MKIVLWRRTRLTVLVGIAVLLAVLSLVLQPDQLTEDSCHHIRQGMTMREVVAILGASPGNYASFVEENQYVAFLQMSVAASGKTVECWQNDNVKVVLIFDQQGRVSGKECYPRLVIPKSPLDTLLRRAKRVWQRWFP